MKKQLSSDATLFDVGDMPADTIDYVRMVLANMDAAKKERKSEVFVRIGITGAGKSPNYWLTFDDPDGSEQSVGTFQSSLRATNYDTLVALTAYSSTRISVFDVRTELKKLRDAV